MKKLVERSTHPEYPITLDNGEGFGFGLSEADAVLLWTQLGSVLFPPIANEMRRVADLISEAKGVVPC